MPISPYVSVQIALFAGTFFIVLVLGHLFKRFILDASSAPQRYGHLDGLRALAAVAVVACHTNQYLLSFFGLPEIPAVGNRLGTIGVQMFFALTAFLFTERALQGRLDPVTFYKGRVRRIAPLYVFAATCTVFLALHVVDISEADPFALMADIVNVFAFGFIGAPNVYLLDFNAGRLIGVAWTLALEWEFYLILPVLLYLVGSSMRLALIVISLIVIVAAKDFIQQGESAWPFFLVGSLVAYMKQRMPVLSTSGRKVLSFLTLPLLIVAVTTPGYFSPPHLFIAFALFFCVVQGEPRVLKGRAMRAIGTISYSVYLLQYLVMAPVVEYAITVDVRSMSIYWKFFTVFLVPLLLIPLSCLSYRLIELPWIAKKAAPAERKTGTSWTDDSRAPSKAG